MNDYNCFAKEVKNGDEIHIANNILKILSVRDFAGKCVEFLYSRTGYDGEQELDYIVVSKDASIFRFNQSEKY